MPVETPKKPSLKEQLANIPMTKGDFATWSKKGIALIVTALEVLTAKVDAKLATIKDGYTPVKGKDYFDGRPGKSPVKGVDYFDGYTPVKGKDYFDGAAANEAAMEARIIEEAVPQIVEIVGKQVPVLGPEIAAALELLPEEQKLDVSALRGWQKLFKDFGEKMGWGGGWGVVGVQGIHVGAGLTVDNSNLQFPKLTVTASTIIYTDTVTTPNIDGSNAIFNVPNTISSAMVLFLAGIPYQPVVDFAVTGPKQITMTLAPDASLSGMPMWLMHT